MKKLVLLAVMVIAGACNGVFAADLAGYTAGDNSGILVDNTSHEIGARPGRPRPPELVVNSTYEIGARPGRPRPPMSEK